MNIVEYVKSRGFKVYSGNMIKCVSLGHKDRTPSLHLDPVNNLFYCHGCGIKGNFEQFKQLLNGYHTFTNTKHKAQKKGSRIEHKKNIDYFAYSEIYEYLEKLCHRLNKGIETCLFYSKAIRRETIKKFRLFYIDDYDRVKKALQKKFKDDVIQTSGLNSILLDQRYSLIIPFIYQNRIVYLQGRYLSEYKGRYGLKRYKKTIPKYKNLNITKPDIFYNQDILINQKKFEKLYIVEGVFDVMALHSEKTDALAVLGIPVNSNLDFGILTKYNNVILAFDNVPDKQGLKEMYNVNKTFKEKYNKSLKFYNTEKLGKFKDFSDYFAYNIRKTKKRQVIGTIKKIKLLAEPGNIEITK